MKSHPTTRRSVYADRLREFPAFAFEAAEAAARRGNWREPFSERIGPAFDGTIVLEIGCSDAAFLSTIAAKHPTTAFVGMDWKYKSLYDGARRVADASLPNVALIHGRGQEVRRAFADGEVDEIWVFHPDPCDRDVELKTRLIGESFLVDAHATLRRPSSVLALKTDHPGYYQWTLGLLGLPQPAWFEAARVATTTRDPALPRVRAGDLVAPQDVPPPSDAVRRRFDVAVNSADYWTDPDAQSRTAGRRFAGETTFFERRFLARRQPIYYVELRKTADR